MGGAKVTLREVADLAGVHSATASRALNPDTANLVNAATARRVREAAERLGYQPNVAARSLKTRRSHTVGVLIPDLTNPLFPPIVRGIEDVLASGSYVALVGNTDNDDERERLLVERMRARHVDALIVATARRRHPLLAEMAGQDLPIVLVNRVVEGHTFASVATDDGMGLRMAVSHLAAAGHRRIGHIAGPQGMSTGFHRYRGFLAGLEAHGLEVADDLVVFAEGFAKEEGTRCAKILLATREPPTAIIAANDLLALGCYQAVEEADLGCPQDVSVVGFNDMPFVDMLRPPLTSVRFPHYRVGAEAAQIALDRIKDPVAPLKVLFFSPELVVRGSTSAPAPANGRSARKHRNGERRTHPGVGAEEAR